MNIAKRLPTPLNGFIVDVPANQYYDFELPAGSNYPLAGVTYPVDYGHIPGYTTEDSHELDLFVGNDLSGNHGSLLVDRGDAIPKEHKFYAALTSDEVGLILKELEPVLIDYQKIDTLEELITTIRPYKD